MGNRHKISLSVEDNPQPLILDETPAIKLSPSGAYNFVSLAEAFPKLCIVYDLRTQADYYENGVRPSYWGWEKNVKQENLVKSEEYLQLLKEESTDKFVLLITDLKRPRHPHTFVQDLKLADAKPRQILLLEDYSILVRDRYRPLIIDELQDQAALPLEIIAPPDMKRAGGYGVFTGSAHEVMRYREALSHFKIRYIVNVSKLDIRGKVSSMPGNVRVEDFLSRFSAPDLMEVALSVQRHYHAKKAVLLLDDTGHEYAAAVVAVFLTLEGACIADAIKKVYIKDILADTNYVESAYCTLGMEESPVGRELFPLGAPPPRAMKVKGRKKETRDSSFLNFGTPGGGESEEFEEGESETDEDVVDPQVEAYGEQTEVEE